MRFLWLPLLLVLAPVAGAAPAADLVVVWAPGARTAPVEAVAHRHGAAVIDRSPAPPGSVQTAQIVHRGIEAYDALKFADAAAVLDQARSAVDRSGAAGLTRAQLSDLFLYRGLVKTQEGDPSSAWTELVTASVIDPTRTLDPLVFPPKVVEEFERAKVSVKSKERARLTVQAPAGCSVTVDGDPATGPIERFVGPHWVRATCPDREPQGTRIELTAGEQTLPVTPAPYAAPTDSELLIQARTASARAIIVAELHGQVATARLVGLDGRERDRRTVTITSDLGPLADAVGDLLTPIPTRHWYESKWAWAGGAAALAAIVLVPITAVIAGGTGPTTVKVGPDWKGNPPW